MLIAGATSGIGKDGALAMARCGARVAVAGLRLQECEGIVGQVTSGGGTGVAVEIDVRSSASVDAAVDSVVAAFGRLDAVFIPAGILRQAPFTTCSMEDWTDVLAVHGAGHANVVAAAARVMRRQRSGRIVTVTSGAAIDGIGELAAYTTAKSAILGMTRSMAEALAADGVMINAISPTAYTPMSRDVPPGDESPVPRRYRRREVDQVSAFVSYLASDLSAGITGRVFMVSGGHVIEFEGPRPLKSVQVAESATPAEIREDIRWILRRPSQGAIGNRPTRDYFFVPEIAGGDAPPDGGIRIHGASSAIEGQLRHSLRAAAQDLAASGASLAGAVLFAGAVDDGQDDLRESWAAVDERLGDVFIQAQRAAADIAPGGVLLVVVPPVAGVASAMLASGLIGFARAAARTLAPRGVAVHAVNGPSLKDDDVAMFVRLVTVLLGGSDLLSGSLVSARRDHVVAFTHEAAVWQHFGDATLDEAWLGAIADAVRSSGGRRSGGGAYP